MVGRYYEHRDENGILKAKYGYALMQHLALEFTGRWKPYKTKGLTTRCFEMEEDRVMTLNGDGIVVYFWTGDKLIEKSC